MAAAIQRLPRSILRNGSTIALNPLITASVLWLLTKAPPAIRDRIFASIAPLRDQRTLSRVVKSLKWLFALGLMGTVNQKLNQIALNAWRLRSQKKRWEWNKEVAVVTGGCSGIGELVVKGLMKKGVRVAVLDVQQLPASLQNYATIKFFACDITNPSAVTSTAEAIRSTMGPPSILINNAGIAQAHSILDAPDDYLQKIFQVNLVSHFTTVKAFLPDMIKANKGHIVTVASLASFISVGGMVDYCSTKAGVLAFHEGLSQELKHHYKAPSVLTSVVHPNWVRTPLIKSYEKTFKATNSRLLEPSVIADRIVKQILSCEGGQLVIPRAAKNISLLRGWPNWLQESVRDGTSKKVLQTLEK